MQFECPYHPGEYFDTIESLGLHTIINQCGRLHNTLNPAPCEECDGTGEGESVCGQCEGYGEMCDDG